MKRIAILLSFLSVYVWADEPVLQSGDLIFHTSASKQSYAIMWASKSLYSHVGIVEVDGKKTYVIEAISKVSRTPLKKWTGRGRLGRYAVYRYKGLDESSRQEIVRTAKAQLGKGYDIYFTSKNRELYCSELVDVVFKSVYRPVGKYEKVKELDFDNLVVRKLVEQRWRKHPVCVKTAKTFDECWAKILEDDLITPESVAQDPHLEKIRSNYP